MAFKGMEDRFSKNVQNLYRGTAKNSGDSPPSIHPLVEFSPLDGRARETRRDSRTFPIGSIRRDVTRMRRFLTSSDGIRFMAVQALLQTGNSFVETRVYNPLFIIGNVQPFKRIGRNLLNPSDVPVRGENISPASNGKVGSAGRLQRHTGTAALARVTGSRSVGASLLSLLPPSRALQLLNSAFSLSRGSGGPNDRPEFNVNGTLYSIMLWKGTQKNTANVILDSLSNMKSQLRSGDVRGALRSLQTSASRLKRGIRSVGLVDKTAALGRDNKFKISINNRYFITDTTFGADRYLRNSITYDGSVPVDNTGFLDRVPKFNSQLSPEMTPRNALPSAIGSTPTVSSIQSKTSNTKVNIKNLRNDIAAKQRRAESAVAASIRKAIPDAITIPDIEETNRNSSLLPPIATEALDTSVENAAEQHMLFPELSLRQRYLTGDRISLMQDILVKQKTNAFDYWNTRKTNVGFVSRDGANAGTDQARKSGRKNAFPSYFRDNMNSKSVILDSGNTEISDSTLRDIKKNLGTDLINVLFFDFVNKTTIPFRAFITGITESVMPEVSDRSYIGRVERNIVYIGVRREVSFQLLVHAMSEAELVKVWRKINYMTGLCYPSKYDSWGFIIPPFVKMTLGDVFRDQPGYIKSLTHNYDPSVSWETTEPRQAPHGITMNITYAILDKGPADTRSIFYPVGITRAEAKVMKVGALDSGTRAALGTTETAPVPIAPTSAPIARERPETRGPTNRVEQSGGAPIVPDNTRTTLIKTAQAKKAAAGLFKTDRNGRADRFKGGGGGSEF